MRPLLVAVLVAVVLASVGCPPRPKPVAFTNADVGRPRGWFDLAGEVAGGATDDATGAPGTGASAREVIEPDVVRRDGSLLFVLNQHRGLLLIDLDTQTIRGRVPTYGYPRDLYVRGNRAYVLVGLAQAYVALDTVANAPANTRLFVVDIANPEAPALLSHFDIQGDLVDSRLVGDVLYAVTAEFVGWAADGGGTIPGGAGGGPGNATEPGRPLKQYGAASWVTSVNVADPGNVFEADRLSFNGQGTVIQATQDAIFVAAPDWNTGNSALAYIDIADPAGALAVRGRVTLPGTVADRFKMDAYQGVLRVVTSRWDGERAVDVTTIDLADPDDLQILAMREIESARGDALFATRFDGDRAYVVTYFLVDPLHVLDLSDPANPKVAGELEVPGWSTHIEPMGDRLLALGVDDTAGRRVCLSLFDVSDPAAPALIERVSFGEEWSWSSAYNDVKAFAVFDDLAVVPFSGWNPGGKGYERLQFISFTPDDLQVRGVVDVSGSAQRTLAYADLHYALTPEELVAIDAADPDNPVVTRRLSLAENVVDFVELAPSLGAEVVSRLDGITVVHTVDGAGARLGHVEIEAGHILEALPFGNDVILVGTAWDGVGFGYGGERYRVGFVDCANPASPAVTDLLDVDVQPFYGYIPLYDIAVGGASLVADAIAPWWIPWQPQDSALLAGDRLVLRCTAQQYDAVVGPGAPTEGLAIIDLNAREWTSTVGLGLSSVSSVHAAGSRVVVGNREIVNAAAFRPLCAYYATELDPATGDSGPTVNVPGLVVQYDPGTDVLVLRDDQWDGLSALESRLRTVRWDGGEPVELLDDALLPDGAGRLLGRGSRVFLDAYGSGGFRLYAASVGADGSLALSGGVAVSGDWATLLDARDDDAFVAVGSNAVEHYQFTAAGGALVARKDVMAPPARVRFGADRAYFVLGYSGVEPMPR